jgi:hypothetical protein
MERRQHSGLSGADSSWSFFNSMSQGDYTLRVYKLDGGDDRVADRAFAVLLG